MGQNYYLDTSYSGIHQYPLGIPVCRYTQGCFVFFLCIDPDLLCGYRFSAGSGPGLTRHTRGFTHATAYLCEADGGGVVMMRGEASELIEAVGGGSEAR